MPHQSNDTVRPLKRCFISHFGAGYVQHVLQQYESTTVLKEPLQSKLPLRNLQTISATNRSHHMHVAKSTLFVVSKDEWDTKEGTGKSMKSTFYEQRCLKRHI